MTESDLSPEFIAKEILGWKFYKAEKYNEAAYWADTNNKLVFILPTFREPEWTGTLIEKVMQYSYWIKIETIHNWSISLALEDKTNIHVARSHPDLNYAIVLAIIEAMK